MYFQLLPPGEELSVEYTFRPDPILSPREFIVALHLIYEDPATGALHSNTVFNSTIDIVEMPKLVDTEMLFMYLMLIGVAVGGGEWPQPYSGESTPRRFPHASCPQQCARSFRNLTPSVG